MKKKVVSVMLTLAMMAAMLAGCGDKKTADSELEENYESSAAQESQEESSAAQEESSAAQEESSEEASADEGGGGSAGAGLFRACGSGVLPAG